MPKAAAPMRKSVALNRRNPKNRSRTPRATGVPRVRFNNVGRVRVCVTGTGAGTGTGKGNRERGCEKRVRVGEREARWK